MESTLETPIEITKTYKIVSFRYEINYVVLFRSAKITISFIDEFGINHRQIDYILQGEEYAGWKDDDQYIIDLITSKIPDLIK
jgi:hypothetical protein